MERNIKIKIFTEPMNVYKMKFPDHHYIKLLLRNNLI